MTCVTACAAHSGRDHSFRVSNVDSVAGNFVAVDIDQKAGLAKFAHHGQFRESGNLRQHVLHLHRFILQDVQVGP